MLISARSVFALSLLAWGAWASTPVPPSATNKPCKDHVPNDPYSFDVRFEDGPNVGKCLVTREQRTVLTLKDADRETLLKRMPVAARTPFETGTYFANFRHKGRFWIVHVPDNAIEDIIFQIEVYPQDIKIPKKYLPPTREGEELAPLMSHSQLRFKLKPGYEATIFPQKKHDQSPPRKLKNLIFSAEAALAEGDTFDIVVGGMTNRYKLALRMTSVSERAIPMIKKQKHDVPQIRLNLSDERKTQIFRNILALGDEYGMTHFYNTLRDSCVTTAFQVIDTGAPDTEYIEKHFARNPMFIYRYLDMRTLRSETDTPLPTLNEELAGDFFSLD